MKDPEERGPDENALDSLAKVFSDQLIACLEEAARGRKGLFGEAVNVEDGNEAWPDAVRLRELAMALQNVFAQQEEKSATRWPTSFSTFAPCTVSTTPASASWHAVFLDALSGGKSVLRPRKSHGDRSCFSGVVGGLQ